MHLLDLTVLLQQVISLTQTLICKPLSRYSGGADFRAHDFEKCKNVFSFSRGSSESSEIHPHWNCCVTPDLLPGLFWRICCPHPHDAVPFAQCSQPSARGIYIHWLGPCEICRCCWFPLCIVNKVRKTHTQPKLFKFFDYLFLRVGFTACWDRCSQCPVFSSPWTGMDFSSDLSVK